MSNIFSRFFQMLPDLMVAFLALLFLLTLTIVTGEIIRWVFDNLPCGGSSKKGKKVKRVLVYFGRPTIGHYNGRENPGISGTLGMRYVPKFIIPIYDFLTTIFTHKYLPEMLYIHPKCKFLREETVGGDEIISCSSDYFWRNVY